MPLTFWSAVVCALFSGFYTNSGYLGIAMFAGLFTVCATVEHARDVIVHEIKKSSPER